MALQPFQFDNLWVALALWALLYGADYYLLLKAQRMMEQYGDSYYDLGGSYSLSPLIQNNSGQLRWVSPRFVIGLVGVGIWLAVWWQTTVPRGVSQVFAAGAGFFILSEWSSITSHITNIALFTRLTAPGSAEGHIRYSRWVTVEGIAWRYGVWGLTYLVFFVLTGSWLFVGGVISDFSWFIRYQRMGSLLRRQLEKQQSKVQESEVETP